MSVVLATAWIVSAAIALRRRRLRYQRAGRIWRESRPERRLDALGPALAANDRGEIDAAAWFLAGCAHLRAGQTRQAARAFGASHHADCDLESAALLTFACLKASTADSSDLLEQIVETWEEMCRPPIASRDNERLMIDCLESTTRDPPELSPIGRLAWAVAGPGLQSRIEAALVDGRPGWEMWLRPGQA